MRVVGIDLAASPKNTGVVTLDISGATARATPTQVLADDDALVEVARETDLLAVDCALGWPSDFVDALTSHHRLDDWPTDDRTNMRYRLTDRVMIEQGSRPLSVSTDMLGVTALRCAHLQTRWRREVWGRAEPRDGSGRLAEVYSAAALKRWGLARRGYKKEAALRAAMLTSLAAEASWLALDEVLEPAIESDHVFDALICTLVGLAVLLGATNVPAAQQKPSAVLEGWIHAPTSSFEEIVPVQPLDRRSTATS